MEYIRANFVHCDIIDEVFSGFSSEYATSLSGLSIILTLMT